MAIDRKSNDVIERDASSDQHCRASQIESKSIGRKRVSVDVTKNLRSDDDGVNFCRENRGGQTLILFVCAINLE